MKNRLLTKSLLLSYKQCPKRFHREYFNPDLVPPKSAYEDLLSKRGDFVTTLAQKEFPQGLLMEERDSRVLAQKTSQALGQNIPLFEAGFIYDDFQVRVDVLNKAELIEVKSGSKLEDRYILDAAIQAYILLKCSYDIKKISVWFLNKECALPDLTNLFVKEDVTEKAKALFPQIEEDIKSMKDLITKEEPSQEIGPHCSKPYDCPFKDYCFNKKGLKELSVLDVPRIGAKGWKLVSEGILELSQLNPEEFTSAQNRMIKAHQTGERFLDLKTLEKFMDPWKFPFYCVDFEAMEYDLPGFAKTKPGQQIPFQVSIHVWKSINAPIEKVAEYLHEGLSDPRPHVSSFLCKHLPEKGTLLAYNAGYEKSKIKDLILNCSKVEAEKLQKLMERFEDPLPFVRETIYDINFKGSYSIKTVAPALLGQEASYDHLAIKDGTEAIVSYRKLIYENLTEVEKSQIKTSLLAYCNQDTLVLAKILKFLYNLAYGS